MRKRGQEEIVGFVFIVVIVAVVLVIFLGISLRQGKTEKKMESKEVYQYIESIMEFTSECAINYEPAYAKISDMIKECYSSAELSCTSGRKVCEILNKNLNELLEASWKFGADRPIKGYVFNISYSSDLENENILNIMKGECKAGVEGAEYLTPSYPGTIISSFKLCY